MLFFRVIILKDGLEKVTKGLSTRRKADNGAMQIRGRHVTLPQSLSFVYAGTVTYTVTNHYLSMKFLCKGKENCLQGESICTV